MEASNPPTRRRRFRQTLVIALLCIAAVTAYVCIPRSGQLGQFDPSELASLETKMWRDYYEHRKLGLAADLYGMWRDQYHFSPLDSLRLANLAANAAIVFKDSTNDEQADQALPPLREYFQIIHDRGDASFDVEDAAKLELQWWKIRRHHVGPDEYAHDIARATAALYNLPPQPFEPYALLRAEAMDYRDRHGSLMTPADWDHVEELLRESYSQLKKSLDEAKFQKSAMVR